MHAVKERECAFYLGTSYSYLDLPKSVRLRSVACAKIFDERPDAKRPRAVLVVAEALSHRLRELRELLPSAGQDAVLVPANRDLFRTVRPVLTGPGIVPEQEPHGSEDTAKKTRKRFFCVEYLSSGNVHVCKQRLAYVPLKTIGILD